MRPDLRTLEPLAPPSLNVYNRNHNHMEGDFLGLRENKRSVQRALI